MMTSNLQKLDGQTVLVRTTANPHNPPVAMRGFIRVLEAKGDGTETKVEVVMEFPDMYNEPAHERIVTLGEEGIQELLASERNGTYELTLTVPLDRASPSPERVSRGSILKAPFSGEEPSL